MMYSKYHILLLSLFLVGGSLSAKNLNEQSEHAQSNNRPVQWHDDFYLADEQDGLGDDSDYSDGSGFEGSGRQEEEVEGSADVPRTMCEKVQAQLQEQHQGAYIPRCTDKGEWEALQCNFDNGECWCVTKAGDKLPGTLRRHPNRPTCDGTDGPPIEIPVSTVKPQHAKPEDSWENENDINIDEPTDNDVGMGSPQDPGNKIDPVPGTGAEILPATDGGGVDARASDPESEPMKASSIIGEPGILAVEESPVDIIPPSPDSGRESAEFSESQARSLERSPIVAQPGILAGIIGGAVVGLLCAVLLVMFIVYRMRKKDEGSYALDEPKRSPPLGYTKARDREFFA